MIDMLTWQTFYLEWFFEQLIAIQGYHFDMQCTLQSLNMFLVSISRFPKMFAKTFTNCSVLSSLFVHWINYGIGSSIFAIFIGAWHHCILKGISCLLNICFTFQLCHCSLNSILFPILMNHGFGLLHLLYVALDVAMYTGCPYPFLLIH